MATLTLQDSGEVIHLREYHTFGRRRHEVDTLLDYAFVSKLHTVIEWKAESWVITDMSSNGTWVNGDRLNVYTPRVPKKGDLIEITGSGNLKFDVVNISAPVDMVYRVDDKLEMRLLDENQLLPNESLPILEVYKCPERLDWFAQRLDLDDDWSTELGPFDHGSQLRCGDHMWEFFVVNEEPATVAIESTLKNVSEVELRFDVSQDEENTSLTLIHNGREDDLAERSHHYLLVYLLRWKASQQAEKTPLNQKENDESLGWMDCSVLAKDLGVDETHMNILVFRARQQITKALVGYSGSSALFQRRRGAIRVGISNYSIYKEGIREI